MKRPASVGLSSSDRGEPPTSSAERPGTALRSFFSPAASSAERPASATSSAQQPATPSQLKISSMRDVERWLAEESIASCDSVDMHDIREAAAVLSCPNPRQEDVRPLQNKWQVAQKKNKKPRPLSEVVHEFQGKVIKATQKLQQQLSDSAAEQSARMDTNDGVDCDDNPMLTRLQARQRRSAQDSAAEHQRPLAKPKASRGRNKRTLGTTCDSVEQPASKRKDRMLTPDLFALGACDPSDSSAASPDWAVRPAPVRQQGEIMYRLLCELRKLSSSAWVVGDADARCKAIIRDAFDLQKLPARQRILTKRSITVLYSSICGPLGPQHEGARTLQDYTHVSFTASMVVERQARQLVQAIDVIKESSMDRYPCLWELKNRQQDAVLNGLPEMPRSPHEFFEILNDAEASASTPFGRLPPLGQAGPPFLKAGLQLMETLYQSSACSGAQSGICIVLSGAMRCLRMMLSHRPLSSFNMSSHRTIWTHVRSNVIIIERIQFPKSIYMNSQTSGKEVFIRLGSSHRVVEKASIHGSLINVLPEYFVRMLACLELPDLGLQDLPIPKHHKELIDKVVQHRSNAADASAGQPAHIRASAGFRRRSL